MAEDEVSRIELAGRLDISSEDIAESGLTSDAYGMFMRYIPIGIIARELNAKESVIKKLIKANGWQKERDALQKDIKKAVRQQAITRLNSITMNGLLIIDVCIKRTLTAYKEEQRAPSVTEAETIAKIVKVAHSLKTYEEGSGASSDSNSMNPGEVLDAFMNDPYMRKIMAGDNITALPPPINNEHSNEDTINSGNIERSASQEASESLKAT